VQLVGSGATGHLRETGRPASEPAPQGGGKPYAEPPTSPAQAGPRFPARHPRRSERGDHSPIPQASASSLRDRVTEPSPGPGSASIRARATLRPTSRRRRLTSARSASSSARGTVTISDASAVTCSSLHSPPLPTSLVPTPDSHWHLQLAPQPRHARHVPVRTAEEDKSSAKPRANDLGLRRTKREVSRGHVRPDLQNPDVARPRPTKLRCMACRKSGGVRIPLAPQFCGSVFG
jgi:hypothetical protein